MAASSKFSDEKLKYYLDLNFTHTEIARYLNVSVSAVTQRAAKLEKAAAARQPQVVAAAQQSVFDTKNAMEANYRGCLELLTDIEADPVRTRTLILQHIKVGMEMLETLYTIQEQQAFQEEVLSVLEECEPGSRQRILGRLRERRGTRAAFSERGVALRA